MPSKKDTSAPKASRGPYRMDERLKVIRALKEMGAKRAEVDGIKVEFGEVTRIIREGGSYRELNLDTAVPPNLEYLAKKPESDDNGSQPVTEPAISGGPHPDEYSRQSDIWANYQPLGR